MPFQKLMNKLTSRDKLTAEIDVLKSRVLHSERRNLEMEKELNSHKQLLSQMQSEKQELLNQLNYDRNKMNKLEERLKESDTDNKRLVEADKAYRVRFGDISVSETLFKNNVWDVDKSFFDHIETIKGNPFNGHQVQAIRYGMEKHLRIIAGAGSGKTETICAKATYLLMMEDVSPSRICMVTFTRKAADEMKERVQQFLGTDNTRGVIGTFHSLFRSLFDLLIKQIPACKSVGVCGNVDEESEEKSNRLFRSLIKEYKLFNLDKHGEKSIKDRVGYWTNLGYSPEEMQSFIAKHYDNIEESSDAPISQRFYEMYNRYTEVRTENNIVVFDDYLLNLYRALQTYESARELVQGKFDYIFVDEFQDINPLQMEILKLISPPGGEGAKLIIVGDDDQSIYAFRGSDPRYIKQFHLDYETHTIELMMNYRSKCNIVHAGNRIISSNAHDRIEKAMVPFHDISGEAYVWAADDPFSEAEWIILKAQEIGKLKPYVGNGRVEPIDYTISTVLYRSVGQLQSVYQALDSRNVPYVIENSDDVIGIFNILSFKLAFRHWEELTKSGRSNPSTQLWRPLLLNAANGYFISNEKFHTFLRAYPFTTVLQLIRDFAGFVKEEKPKSEIPLVLDYLQVLMKLASGEPVVMSQIVEPFLQFPKQKKELSKEEIDWIKKECSHYKTWADLVGYYKRLLDKQRLMKKHLELYHKGDYNALYFLTIHKSKGLAFDNVFVIGVFDGGLPSKRAVALRSVKLAECREKAEPPTTIEEERRLIYVAATRAKHNLYVTFPKTMQNKPCRRSVFIQELLLEIKNG